MAGQSFPDNAVGGVTLLTPAIQSPNFVHNSSGWQVNQNGSAEFNNLQIRGTFNGTDFVINSVGAFFYSSTPAAGNLILSITASTTGGTESFGNHYVPLTGWYDNSGGFFTQIGAGFITFGTGSLSGGWTANTSIQNDSSGNLFLGANAHIFANGVQIA